MVRLSSLLFLGIHFGEENYQHLTGIELIDNPTPTC